MSTASCTASSGRGEYPATNCERLVSNIDYQFVSDLEEAFSSYVEHALSHHRHLENDGT